MDRIMEDRGLRQFVRHDFFLDVVRASGEAGGVSSYAVSGAGTTTFMSIRWERGGNALVTLLPGWTRCTPAPRASGPPPSGRAAVRCGPRPAGPRTPCPRSRAAQKTIAVSWSVSFSLWAHPFKVTASPDKILVVAGPVVSIDADAIRRIPLEDWRVIQSTQTFVFKCIGGCHVSDKGRCVSVGGAKVQLQGSVEGRSAVICRGDQLVRNLLRYNSDSDSQVQAQVTQPAAAEAGPSTATQQLVELAPEKRIAVIKAVERALRRDPVFLVRTYLRNNARGVASDKLTKLPVEARVVQNTDAILTLLHYLYNDSSALDVSCALETMEPCSQIIMRAYIYGVRDPLGEENEQEVERMQEAVDAVVHALLNSACT